MPQQFEQQSSYEFPGSRHPEEVLAGYLTLLENKNFRQAFSPGIASGMIGLLQATAEKVRYSVLPQKNKPQFEQWNARNYVDLLARPVYRDEKVLTSLLSQNFDAFAAEYTRGQLVWSREYIFGEDGSILGLANSYQDDLASDRHGNFSSALAEQQKSTQRSDIEDGNLLKLKTWICDSPLNSLFVWSSPPGLLSDGYTGLNSHSFTFVYHKTENRKARVYQYRTWMPLYQHAALQTSLDSIPSLDGKNLSHHLIENTQSLTAPVQKSERWAQAMIGVIQQSLYAKTADWRIKPEEMPEIDEVKFLEMRDFLFSLYIREVVPLLLGSVPTVESAENPVWITFLKSPEYKKLIKQLDTAFAVFAYQPLARFVQETTADESHQTLWHQVKNSLKKKDETSLDITTATQPEIFEHLHRLNSILMSDKVSASDKKWFNTNAPGFLNVSDRIFSLGQCGLGTLIPSQLPSMSFLELNSLSAPQLLQLVGEERFKLWKPNQTCLGCQAKNVWVGECNICYQCEYKDSHGDLKTEFSLEEEPEFQKLATTEQEKTRKIFSSLRDTLIVKSASVEKIFLLGDILTRSSDLHPIILAIYQALERSVDPLAALLAHTINVIKNKNQLEELERALELH